VRQPVARWKALTPYHDRAAQGSWCRIALEQLPVAQEQGAATYEDSVRMGLDEGRNNHAACCADCRWPRPSRLGSNSARWPPRCPVARNSLRKGKTLKPSARDPRPEPANLWREAPAPTERGWILSFDSGPEVKQQRPR
jgi:hypothetical protein